MNKDNETQLRRLWKFYLPYISDTVFFYLDFACLLYCFKNFVWESCFRCRSVAFPQHLAGHSVSRHEFQNSYVKDLTSDNQDNIVLFMQDEVYDIFYISSSISKLVLSYEYQLHIENTKFIEWWNESYLKFANNFDE